MPEALVEGRRPPESLKAFAGTCIDSFDADGDCLAPALGWSHVSDFAVADEQAVEITEAEFCAQATIGPEILALVAGHKIRYLAAEGGVLMLYDAEGDIHYFFA